MPDALPMFVAVNPEKTLVAIWSPSLPSGFHLQGLEVDELISLLRDARASLVVDCVDEARTVDAG